MKMCVSVVGLLAVSAAAQAGTVSPFYATGGWNGFTFPSGAVMTQIDSVKWSKTYTIAPGAATDTTVPGNTEYFGKGSRPGFTDDAPSFGQAAKFVTPSSGSITFNLFDQTSWSDGWLPSDRRRFGYAGTTYDWDLMGSWNGFSSPTDLTSLGNGVYEGQITLTAGNYSYKFRRDNDWGYNIGDNGFGHDAGNVNFTAGVDAVYTFRLDLPNGRFQVVPAPGAAALLGLGGLVAARRRRN